VQNPRYRKSMHDKFSSMAWRAYARLLRFCEFHDPGSRGERQISHCLLRFYQEACSQVRSQVIIPRANNVK